MNHSHKALEQQQLCRQITLFQHFSEILQHLAKRISDQPLSPAERRLMQRELASLKKATRTARSRLKASRSSARTGTDTS